MPRRRAISNWEYTRPLRSLRAGGMRPRHSMTLRWWGVTPSWRAASAMCTVSFIRCIQSSYGDNLMHIFSDRKACKNVQRKADFRRAHFKGLVNPVESLAALTWPVSENYSIVNGWIRPHGMTRYTCPLEDPGLFLSFAALGQRGDPAQPSILNWTRKYGLLTSDLRQWNLPIDDRFRVLSLDERVVQKEMRVEDFLTEVRCANQLLNLYADIKAPHLDNITKTFTTPPSSQAYSRRTVIDRLQEAYWNSRGGRGFAKQLAQGEDPLGPRYWLGAAQEVLQEAIFYLMKDVRLEAMDLYWPIDDDTEEEDPDFRGFYRFVTCPDLLSAVYLQFYLMVTGNKPMRRCKVCGQPFPLTKSNKYVCNATCRSNARHQRNAEKRRSSSD